MKKENELGHIKLEGNFEVECPIINEVIKQVKQQKAREIEEDVELLHKKELDCYDFVVELDKIFKKHIEK